MLHANSCFVDHFTHLSCLFFHRFRLTKIKLTTAHSAGFVKRKASCHHVLAKYVCRWKEGGKRQKHTSGCALQVTLYCNDYYPVITMFIVKWIGLCVCLLQCVLHLCKLSDAYISLGIKTSTLPNRHSVLTSLCCRDVTTFATSCHFSVSLLTDLSTRWNASPGPTALSTATKLAERWTWKLEVLPIKRPGKRTHLTWSVLAYLSWKSVVLWLIRYVFIVCLLSLKLINVHLHHLNSGIWTISQANRSLPECTLSNFRRGYDGLQLHSFCVSYMNVLWNVIMAQLHCVLYMVVELFVPNE